MPPRRSTRQSITYTRRAYLAHMRTACADLQALRERLRAYTPEGLERPAMVHIPVEILYDMEMQLWLVMQWLRDGPGTPMAAFRRELEGAAAHRPGETLILGDDDDTDDDGSDANT